MESNGTDDKMCQPMCPKESISGALYLAFHPVKQME